MNDKRGAMMRYTVVRNMYLFLGCFYLISVLLIAGYAFVYDLGLPTLYFIWIIVGGILLFIFRRNMKRVMREKAIK
ncbi:hypothetical protein [Guptibacillus sedimenti]|uniref:hypothetical protein n=1 Tax=Guptibacillus sedimenti TaxID=3025680 RepID=UPI002361DCCA|nr:hypothetical protein [Pseudalkalibacillus sedimenti]